MTANAAATDFPCPGAVIDHLRRDAHVTPTAVSLPTMIADGPFRTPGEFAGFLGKLVLWTGDFGRTPKVNKDAGRVRRL